MLFPSEHRVAFFVAWYIERAAHLAEPIIGGVHDLCEINAKIPLHSEPWPVVLLMPDNIATVLCMIERFEINRKKEAQVLIPEGDIAALTFPGYGGEATRQLSFHSLEKHQSGL